jgi:hypothetical protein
MSLVTGGVALAATLALFFALGTPYAVGGALVMIGYTVFQALGARGGGDDRKRAHATWQLGAVVAACTVAALVIVVTAIVFERSFFAACNAAARTRTLAERRRAWEAVRSHAWLARRLSEPTLEACNDEQLDETTPGAQCARFPMDDVSCMCGGAGWPGALNCGSQRAFCGCVEADGACRTRDDCCSGQCNSGRCEAGYWSGQIRTLQCVAP